MNRNTTAVFIGHSDCREVSLEILIQIIEQCVKEGIDTFLNGGQGGFDRLCAQAVSDLKSKYPNIKNYLIIPYHNFRIFNKNLFDDIIFPFDKEITSYSGYKFAIPKRNKWMVEHASTGICYVTHISGGAHKTLELAQNKKLIIKNIPNQ